MIGTFNSLMRAKKGRNSGLSRFRPRTLAPITTVGICSSFTIRGGYAIPVESELGQSASIERMGAFGAPARGGRLVVLTAGGFAHLWFVPTSAKRLAEEHV